MDHAPTLAALEHLLSVVARLRAPDGCPWDRAQTTTSMAPHLLEEAHEAVEALRRTDDAAASEELGDVLMNVLMIAQIAAERGAFDAGVVARGIADKLVRRHPHVFGTATAVDAGTAFANWEAVKQAERATAPGARKGLLDGVPASLPALLKAQRVGEKAARVGFDWPDRTGPRAKVDEELRELDEALHDGDADAIAAELGDVLFSVVNLGRHAGVSAELALQGTVDRFRERFASVERALDGNVAGTPLDELERLWQRAKNG